MTAIRVSLAHAYYGTPQYAIPFKMKLPRAFHTPLPRLDNVVHQVFIVRKTSNQGVTGRTTLFFIVQYCLK